MDHPMAQGVLDMMLGSEVGNTAFGVWKDSGKEGLLLEVWFVAESVAPRQLHADRFLPPTPFRVVVDHAGSDQGDGSFLDEVDPEAGDLQMLLDQGPIRKRVLPAMIEKAKGIAVERLQAIVSQSVVEMDRVLGGEIERLKGLQRMNDHVRLEEVVGLESQREALRSVLTGAEARIDALRLLHRLP
jgi:ATP-dependent helicase HepA